MQTEGKNHMYIYGGRGENVCVYVYIHCITKMEKYEYDSI